MARTKTHNPDTDEWEYQPAGQVPGGGSGGGSTRGSIVHTTASLADQATAGNYS